MKRGTGIIFLCAWFSLAGAGLANASDDADDGPDQARRDVAGAVYTMTNASTGNSVLLFNRAADGTLTAAGSFPTGGSGTGRGLGNQSALALSEDQRWLFAVNAGSSEVSVFSVKRSGLELVDKVPSGGTRPVSLSVDHDLLYVLNAGGTDNITGFTIGRRGKLSPLPGSTRLLSGTGTAPAQVQFNPKGNVLVVTEKATNLIDTYIVGDDGLANGPFVQASAGATPFGFAFDRQGRMFVSDAARGAPGASSVSSYRISSDGNIQAISPTAANTETASCWVVISNDGRFAYTTNTGSGSISGYRVAKDGSLTLRDADGRTGDTGAGSAPLDMSLSRDGRYLYTLNSGNGTIGAFSVGSDGELAAFAGISGLPAGANGMAAR